MSQPGFSRKGGAILGLENLVVDGQGQHPGVEIGETANFTFIGTNATLYATDVTFQRCLLTWSKSSGNPYGGAAILAQNTGSRVELTRAELLDNTCSNCHAGGLELFLGPVAVLEEVGVSATPCHGWSCTVTRPLVTSLCLQAVLHLIAAIDII
jgi:hypothetical protein